MSDTKPSSRKLRNTGRINGKKNTLRDIRHELENIKEQRKKS